MRRAYQVIERKNRQALTDFLSCEGSALLPIVDLIQRTETAVDELVDAAGRSAIEAVLTLSARQIAGPKHQGKRTSWPPSHHESQPPPADQAAEVGEGD